MFNSDDSKALPMTSSILYYASILSMLGIGYVACFASRNHLITLTLCAVLTLATGIAMRVHYLNSIKN